MNVMFSNFHTNPAFDNIEVKSWEAFYFCESLTWSCMFAMIAFNVWSWYLALTGQTTIEFWGSKMKIIADNPIRFNFSYTSISTNLYVIFGTRNYLKMFFGF